MVHFNARPGCVPHNNERREAPHIEHRANEGRHNPIWGRHEEHRPEGGHRGRGFEGWRRGHGEEGNHRSGCGRHESHNEPVNHHMPEFKPHNNPHHEPTRNKPAGGMLGKILGPGAHKCEQNSLINTIQNSGGIKSFLGGVGDIVGNMFGTKKPTIGHMD